MLKSLYSKEIFLLSNILTNLREEKKYSQRQLSELLGMYTSFVGKYEIGERDLDIFDLFYILYALEQDEVKTLSEIYQKWKKINKKNLAVIDDAIKKLQEEKNKSK